MPRAITHAYADPLDLAWLAAAAALGWRVLRSSEVFASWDGKHTLTLSTAEHLDADDSLAQLIFHEICHALVEGEAALALVDWGLCNRDERHLVHEHACHRLQAALAGEHGLRTLLAPTTEHRPYYDALPQDPLASAPEVAAVRADAEATPRAQWAEHTDPALPLARAGWERAQREPWASALQTALSASAALAAVVAPLAPADSLWRAISPEHPHPNPRRLP